MPREWRQRTLRELIQIKHGYAFSGKWIHEEPTGDVLLTPGNFAIGGGFKADKLKYYNGPVPDEFILGSGDLLVTMTDLSKHADTLGYPAFVPRELQNRRYLHNQRLGKITIVQEDTLDVNFLYYLLCSLEYRQEVLSSATGTTVKHTSPERIRRFTFRCPPLAEQKEISGVLRALDEKIGVSRQVNTTLESIARALFKSWFVDFDPVIDNALRAENPIPSELEERASRRTEWLAGSIRDPGLQPAISSMFPDSFEESTLGPVPRGWEVSTIAAHARIGSGKRPTGSSSHMTEQCRVPLFGGAGIMGYVPEPLYNAPIIVTGRVGTLGKVLRTSQPSWPSDNALVVVPHTEALFELVFYALRRLDILSLNRGSTQPLLTQSDLGALPFVVPNANVLEKWHSVAGSLLARMDSADSESQTLTALRNTLLPRLLGGATSIQEGHVPLDDEALRTRLQVEPQGGSRE